MKSVRVSIVLLLLVGGAWITGCSTCLPGVSLYVRGSMVTIIDSSGAFAGVDAATASDSASLDIVTLRSEADTGFVRANVPFVLNVPDVLDLGKLSLRVDRRLLPAPGNDAQAGSDQDEFIITLVDACLPSIVLREKCEIVNWYNPFRLPNIEVRSGFLDQVIATPIITADDYIAGYEIRLGDQGVSNCTSPAYASWLNRYRGDRGKKTSGKALVLTLSTSPKAPSPLTSFQKPVPTPALKPQRHR